MRYVLTYQANYMASGSEEYLDGYADALTEQTGTLHRDQFVVMDSDEYLEWREDGKPWEWLV